MIEKISKQSTNNHNGASIFTFLGGDFYSGLAMRAMEEASYIFQMFCRCTPNSAEPHLLDMNGGGKKTIVILKDRVWDRFMRNIDNYGVIY